MAGSTVHARIGFTLIYLHATVTTSVARITGTSITFSCVMILDGDIEVT